MPHMPPTLVARLGPTQPPPHRCRTFPLLLVHLGYSLLCGLSVAQKNKPSTMLPSNVQSIDLPMACAAWPDGSGRWDNRMAAQHLPRDLVRPSSGLNNYLKRKRRIRKDWVPTLLFNAEVDLHVCMVFRFSTIFLVKLFLVPNNFLPTTMFSCICNVRVKIARRKLCKANWFASRDYTDWTQPFNACCNFDSLLFWLSLSLVCDVS